LQKRALAEGVHIDPPVLQYLAEKIRSNIRSLEGSLTRLLAMASLDGRKINLDLAAETVRYYSTTEAEPVKVEVDTIIRWWPITSRCRSRIFWVRSATKRL
jgi:chromosomal replication initiator protein